jgi:glyoxylase-like metal-dependent hydrolase (beta-lactamase superfamily II)
MQEIRPGVRLLDGRRDAINVYLVDDVLVDAGTRWAWRRIRRELARADATVAAHALTHAHPDHQGSSARVCRELDVPFWVPAGEREPAETGGVAARMPGSVLVRLQQALWTGPGHPVDRELREGDAVGGFEVIETPGHSPGHVSYWRPSDGTLLVGDVLVNMDLLTTRPGLAEPPRLFTSDPARNRASARRLADLEPEVVCFGHGPVLRDGDAFVDFVATLPHGSVTESTGSVGTA